jgi:hypothetical protein
MTTSPRSRLVAVAVAAAALAAACTPDFEPASKVSDLRVLAVRAEPPEVAPPGDASAPARTALGALVAHPAFATEPARRAVVLHVACTPDPGDPSAAACIRLSALADPAELLPAADPTTACSAPGTGKRGAITFSGLEACGALGCEPVKVRRDPADPSSEVTLPAPAYEVPADLSFDGYAPGAKERVLGLEVQDLALAVDVGPEELAPTVAVPDACSALVAVAARLQAAWSTRTHVTSLKRLRIRGPEARSAPNVNPVVDGMTLGGTRLAAPDAAPSAIAPRAAADLLPVLPGDFEALRETYVRVDAAGAPIETRQEDWAFSWFATAGDLDDLHTQSPAEGDRYTAPASGRVLLWTVVRDLRGGISWSVAAADARP